jgi:hypothetical protein
MNRLRAAIIPASFWVCFHILRACNFLMASTLVEFAYIP